MILSRRAALLGLGAAWSLGSASLALADPVATPGDRRFVVVMLRGAMDGMSAVVPYGDRTLASWRASLLPAAIGQTDGMLDLGGFFGLHPALSGLHALYAAGDMLPVHAVAGGYRSRSHFEAQDYMESGADHRLTSGWLNRVVGALPRNPAQPDGNGLSVGLSTPLILRGPALVGAYAPEATQVPSPDLYSRIAALNASDPLTGPAIAHGLAAKDFAAGTLSPGGVAAKGGRNGFPALRPRRAQRLATPASGQEPHRVVRKN